MPQIRYLTDGRTIEIGSDTTLLRASFDHGIAHTHVCGGNAKYSTCRVLVTEGLEHCCARNEREAQLARDRRFGADIRLACQTAVSGDVTPPRLVLDAEDTGPRHCGLFGRRAGSVMGFAYSNAIKRSKIIWDEKTLDRFLANPLKAVPGTAMGYAGIPDNRERADLIAYLKRANESPQCGKSLRE